MIPMEIRISKWEEGFGNWEMITREIRKLELFSECTFN